MLLQNVRKLEQLRENLSNARNAFGQAREKGASRDVLEERAAVLVKANKSVQRFLSKHPELAVGEE
jgi:hypothetical protein